MVQEEDTLLKVIRQHQVGKIHLRWQSEAFQLNYSRLTHLDSAGIGCRRWIHYGGSGEQVDQPVGLMVPVLLLFPRFGRISRLVVDDGIHTEDFSAGINAEDSAPL